MKNATFTNRDLQRLAGLTSRQITHLAERGVVVPEVRDAAGQGTVRRYSLTDAIKILLVKGLRDVVGLEFSKLIIITTVVSSFFDELGKLLDGKDERIPTMLHWVDGQYGFLSSPDAGTKTQVFQVTREGRARFSRKTPEEVLDKATFHLTVDLEKVMKPLRDRLGR